MPARTADLTGTTAGYPTRISISSSSSALVLCTRRRLGSKLILCGLPSAGDRGAVHNELAPTWWLLLGTSRSSWALGMCTRSRLGSTLNLKCLLLFGSPSQLTCSQTRAVTQVSKRQQAVAWHVVTHS